MRWEWSSEKLKPKSGHHGFNANLQTSSSVGVYCELLAILTLGLSVSTAAEISHKAR